MPAIATTKFRLENAIKFVESISDESVYLAISKSDSWISTLETSSGSPEDTPAATGNLPADVSYDEKYFWQNVIALKKILPENVLNVAARHTWTSGTTYVAWDDNPTDGQMYDELYYVIYESKIYKCIIAGSGGSTVPPTHGSETVQPKKYSDGYYWKYMQTVYADDATKFLLNSYIPVKNGVDGGSTDEQDKYEYEQSSKTSGKGKIYRYVVVDGGQDYTDPVITIHGDGTGAQASATVVDGEITSVIVLGSDNPNANTAATNFAANSGSNYNVAYVTVTDSTGGSGTGAVIRAVLSPGNGHGTDPIRELGAYYVGVRSTLSGTEAGTFIVNNAFRQIGIIKNPRLFDDSAVATANTINALKTMKLSAISGDGPVEGEYITGASSGAVAFVDYVYVSGGLTHIRYHQNDKTGYVEFEAEESLNGSLSGTGTGTITTPTSTPFIDPGVLPFSGNVLFIDNRSPINRTTDQIEDIKVIVEF